MAKGEKRQKQEEDAAEKMKQAEMEYKAKIDVANQKQNKIKDETSNTARELQVESSSQNMLGTINMHFKLYINSFS